eukprot:GFUD01053135.1.p1 GENE.GFUD01053135.1~~GFUD01053135.1.p1  ORF type:complete len:454 (-),score=95.63 GFUD01053135.1:124-1461(-)
MVIFGGLVLFILLGWGGQQGEAAGCKQPWIQLDTGCYLFLGEEKSTWMEARDKCEQEGGYLVKVDSKEENDAIFGEIQSKFYSQNKKVEFWIGLFSDSFQYEWKWVSSGMPLGSYSNWAQGEPSPGEKCVLLGHGNNWTNRQCWTNNYTPFTYNGLCEKEGRTTTTTTPPTVWNPIMDCYTKLALTADSSQTGSGLSTKSLTGADNQLWMMDSEGRVVSKQSGLVIDGKAGRPYLQQPTPLTSSKQWKIRSDITSTHETGTGVNVPKLVENGRQYCLNTANRYLTQGSHVIMWNAARIHSDNACWETTFLVWKPILDCFTGLALTTLGSGEGSALSTKPLSGKDNQMWAFDSKKRIVNKESGLVIDGRGGTQFMKQPTPLTDSKQWNLRTDIRSYQETATATVQKLVENGREHCLNTQNRFSSGGSTIIMYSAAHVHPDNACWKF